MQRSFRKSIRRFCYQGIEMIGDIESGLIFGLSDDGARLTDSIMQMNKYSVNDISLEQQELLVEMENSGFFDLEFNEPSPMVAYFHVTSKCNLNCIGCYSYEEHRNKVSNMSLASVKKVLTNIKKSGVSHLVISGGEPMLRDDISEILHYAKNECEFERITLISNGIVPHEKYIGIMNFIDEIAISIEGYDETSSFIRNGSVKTVLDTVRYLSAIDAPVSMIVTLHKRNIDYISEYTRLSQELRVPFSFSMLTIPHGQECNGCELEESDYLRIGNILGKKSLPLSDVPFCGVLSCKRSCGVGRTIISVASDARIYPCHMLQDGAFCIGNALEDDICECIKINAAWSVEQIDECRNCEVKYLCGGGCYARRIFNYSCIDLSHDPCCNIYKAGILATLKSMISVE